MPIARTTGLNRLLPLSLLLATMCGYFVVGRQRPAAAAKSATAAGIAQKAPAATSDQTAGAPVIDLDGTPAEIGAAHGRRLGAGIRLLHDQFLSAYLGTTAHRFLAMAAASAFESRLLPEYRDELEALAETTGIDRREVVLGQCFLDLSPMTACSTIALPAAASTDGVARFGRNLDFSSFNVADKYSTVFIYHPRGRYQFASIGWPGLIGVLSGMNEHGLALANMEVSRLPRLPTAMPYTLLYRTILEQCRTVEEAIQLLRQTSRQTPNNLMLMDASGARAVAEITPADVVVRRGADDAALISTNHQRGSDAATPGRCRRYDFLRKASAEDFGQIDRGSLEQMLKAVSQGNRTLQSMVFEPQRRVLYLSVGKRAASHHFYEMPLAPLFAAHPKN